MNIIMLGAQGTGKGTVAGLISGEIGIPQISTGDIFRKNISEKTPLGIEADKYISKGFDDCLAKPIVEEELYHMLRKFLKEVKEVKRARLTEYAAARPSAQYHEGKGVWTAKVDIALPCATQNELNLEDAKALVANGVFAVAFFLKKE